MTIIEGINQRLNINYNGFSNSLSSFVFSVKDGNVPTRQKLNTSLWLSLKTLNHIIGFQFDPSMLRLCWLIESFGLQLFLNTECRVATSPKSLEDVRKPF